MRLVGILFRVLQRNGPIGKHRDIHVRGDLLQELAHVVMRAKESYNMSSTSGRPRKPGSVTQTESLRPENQGSSWCKSLPVEVWRSQNRKCWRPRAGEDGFPSSSKESRFVLSAALLFYWGPPRIAWCPPTLMSQSLLSPWIQVWISSGNTLSNTLRNNVCPAIWASVSSIKSTHKIGHHHSRVMGGRNLIKLHKSSFNKIDEKIWEWELYLIQNQIC